jgi:thiol-disulfide isomerase/thioredoxin
VGNRAVRRRASAQESAPRWGWGRIAALAGTFVVMAAVVAIAVVNSQSVPKIASDAPILAHVAVGDSAPPFSVTTLDGKTFDSTKIATPIVLEVFATWCPHCQHETGDINALSSRFGNALNLVAVSGSPYAMDRASVETLGDVRDFAQQLGVEYPIAYDGDLTVAKAYLQGAYPTIVFINPQKKITAIETGEVSLDKLVADAQKAGAHAPSI